MTIAIIIALVETGGLLLIGWIARQLRYVTRDEVDRFSIFAVDFLMPLLIFSSTFKGLEVQNLCKLWPLPLLGLGIVVGGMVCGLSFRHGLGSRDPDVRRTFVFFCGINNYGYIPIIMVNTIWGSPAMLANLFLLNLGSTVGLWIFGVNVLGGAEMKKIVRNMFAPSLVALIAALTVKILAIPLPDFFIRITSSAGAAAIPLIIIMMGASLHDVVIKTGWRDLLYSTVIRLVILPLIFIGIFRFLPISPDICNIAMIVALMPVGISSSTFVRRYGGDADFAARATVVSTIIAVITVPVAMHLFAR
jgi:predicted permease